MNEQLDNLVKLLNDEVTEEKKVTKTGNMIYMVYDMGYGFDTPDIHIETFDDINEANTFASNRKTSLLALQTFIKQLDDSDFDLVINRLDKTNKDKAVDLLFFQYEYQDTYVKAIQISKLKKL